MNFHVLYITGNTLSNVTKWYDVKGMSKIYIMIGSGNPRSSRCGKWYTMCSQYLFVLSVHYVLFVYSTVNILPHLFFKKSFFLGTVKNQHAHYMVFIGLFYSKQWGAGISPGWSRTISNDTYFKQHVVKLTNKCRNTEKHSTHNLLQHVFIEKPQKHNTKFQSEQIQ